MSSSRPLSRASTSKSAAQRLPQSATPKPLISPRKSDRVSEPCAATASFLLYSEGNQITVLRHDTLAIERRFSLHLELVLWIVADNVSERGSGRLAVSFDAGRTAIVWDILKGEEISRFSAYEHMRTASFMRNGNIAFGNDQGNIILYEPSTSEHVSSRTIFDPITAIAPATDCRTFAIGYANGSILIATLQPSFTILHTLSTSRAPSRILGLAWHGSSSKSKSDMLATQTQDGDLRVWSVPKVPHSEPPCVIRVLEKPSVHDPGLCWFAWSKNGRLVQYSDGETRSWDVRTKRVTYDIIPTSDGIVGITNYGPNATLFTLGRDHTVQQYDINPANVPLQVAARQHIPAAVGGALELRQGPMAPSFTDVESSADESAALSPLQKIAKEIDTLDALRSEERDTLMPLSPTSREGSISSRSSGKSSRRGRKYLYDKPDSSRASSTSGYNGTEFSFGTMPRTGRDSISAMSTSSFDSGSQSHHRGRSSNLRQEVLRSPDERSHLDLFPYLRGRLREVPFRPPHYGEGARTAELLQREMLSVVFGWEGDITSLIRHEISLHRARSASSVLLSKWLGDIGADSMSSLIGSESMTSSDWMLLALSSIGKDSQKKVGEAFVQRLLEKGDVHPAVAILLGLGESNDAIEVYVSQHKYMEALLLTCLVLPSDWQRVSHLLRLWGEAAIKSGDPEVAVRCLSCTSIETTEPWRSPTAQDAIYAAQQERLTRPPSIGPVTSPTFSIPSQSASGRIKNSSLKLITSFGEKGAPILSDEPVTTKPITAITPIVTSALPMSPGGGMDPWRRTSRDPSAARTATPGGYTRRKRLPSKSDIERAKLEVPELTTPLTAARDFVPPTRGESRASNSSRRTGSISISKEPMTALRPNVYNAEIGPRTVDHLPSPSQGAFKHFREGSLTQTKHREAKPSNLSLDRADIAYVPSPMITSHSMSLSDALQSGTLSPPLTGGSLKASVRARAAEGHISSLEEARRARAESRKRADGRTRSSGRNRDRSETRGKGNVRYVKPAKRSPSSPVPMSPEEIAQASNSKNAEPATTDDEDFYKSGLASPVESHKSGRTAKSESKLSRKRTSAEKAIQQDLLAPPAPSSRSISRKNSPEALLLKIDDGRGRSEQRSAGALVRSLSSPSSPLPMLTDRRYGDDKNDGGPEDPRFRLRSQSAHRQGDDLQSRRQISRDGRARSGSRRRFPKDDAISPADYHLKRMVDDEASQLSFVTESAVSSSIPSKGGVAESWLSSNVMAKSVLSDTSASVLSSDSGSRLMSRKQMAARELEERRRSLARRPSAPQIPLPEELNDRFTRPGIGMRSNTDLGDSPTSFLPPLRSQTADPELAARRFSGSNKITGLPTSTASIGLPATPRAMRHPRYMGSDGSEREHAPAVPGIPPKFSDLSPINGSMLSQTDESQLSQASSFGFGQQRSEGGIMLNPSQLSSLVSAGQESELSRESNPDDEVGPLLPSTVYGQKSIPPRSASVPIEQGSMHSLYRSGPATKRNSASRSHVKKISPPDASSMYDGPEMVTSIDAALHVSPVIIVPEQDGDQTILPELRHLADLPIPPPPPPPPPPAPPGLPSTVLPMVPNSLGVINIAIDDGAPLSAIDTHAPQFPAMLPRSMTASPTQKKNSSGGPDSFGSKIRGFGDRMRSSSKSRTKSPFDVKPAPYESVLPPASSHYRHASLTHRAQSPYEQAMAEQLQQYTSATSSIEPRLNETTIPPSSLPNSRPKGATSGYRVPREVRANVPPDSLQQGAYTFL